MNRTTFALASTFTLVAAAFVAVVPSRSASAAMLDGLGTWEGTGSMQDAAGNELGTMSVTVTRTSPGPKKLRNDIKVKLADGRELVYWQDLEDKGARGFTIVSNRGTGGGQCFANGLCQTYEQSRGGHAFATTLVKDGTDKVRLVTTELEAGRAVRFFQQSLERK
ncbi:MAG: hypothetical protein U0169_10600 [Polyangiaceae bacterium]